MSMLERLAIPRRLRVRDDALARAVAGRTVVVTGASSGIGEQTARRLGGAGARLVLVARTAAALERVAAPFADAVVLPCDLTDAAATEELGRRLAALEADVLINNAGHSIRRSVTRSQDVGRDAERLMALNYLAPVRLIGALLPGLRERRGQVVCVSSIVAQTSAPGFAAYAASKVALDAFVRCAARERGARGVAFTSVYMPLVRTRMMAPSPDLTEAVPSLSPEAAATLVADAIVHRPRRVGTTAGELAALGWAMDPAIYTTIDRGLERVARPGGPTSPPGGSSRPAGRGRRRVPAWPFTTIVRR